MVLDTEFPPDPRVEKEIRSLTKAGFAVAIAAYTRKGRHTEEVYNGYTIYRKKISSLMYRSSAACLLHPFYFWFWYRFLDRILKCGDYTVIHIHDLPLSKTGYKLAKKYRLKLVCDQHEYYSNWIVRTRHYNTRVGKVVKMFSNWVKYERKYLQKADLVITVEESLRNIYIEHVGILPEKIITLPNTPDIESINPSNIDTAIIKKYASHFVLFYAGTIDHLRGIDFIIEALEVLSKDIKNVLFVIAGKENKSFSIAKLMKKYNVRGYVEFVGWVPVTLLPSYIAASNVCLSVPKADNIEVNNAIPTKVYQYAAMGKPILVSEARLMKEFVVENNLGFSINYGNIGQFCEIIKKIRNEPEISEHFREHGVNLIKRYSWEHTALNFLKFYSYLNN